MARKKTKFKNLKPVFEMWSDYLMFKKVCQDAFFVRSITGSIHRFCEDTMVFAFMNAGKGNGRNSSKRKSGVSSQYRYIAYRFVGMPDKEQEVLLRKTAGCTRWLWNRMKADSDEHYKEAGETLYRTPAQYKKMDGLDWLCEIDSYALCNVQLQFESARSDWLKGEKDKPRFKKKHLVADSFTTNKDSRSDNLLFDEYTGTLKLPKFKNPIRLKVHRKVTPGGTLKNCTVTHEPDGRWYFSMVFEYPLESKHSFSPGLEEFLETGDLDAIRHIGLDMSLPHMYIDSDGNHPGYILNGVSVTFTRPYRRLEKKLAREQRRLSKMVKDSCNYKRQCEKIAKLYAKAKHQRNDFLHQVAVRLARSYDVISIEDLDMSAMKQALCFGKSVSDIGWGTFISILEEKCLEYGSILIRVDKWFPSSKTCCKCGKVHKELKLSDRTFICPYCGYEMDRDHQAARNIDREGLRMVLEYLTQNNEQEAA